VTKFDGQALIWAGGGSEGEKRIACTAPFRLTLNTHIHINQMETTDYSTWTLRTAAYSQLQEQKGLNVEFTKGLF